MEAGSENGGVGLGESGVLFQWPKLLGIPVCSFLVCSFPKRTKKVFF
jgi:hypothetical protein